MPVPSGEITMDVSLQSCTGPPNSGLYFKPLYNQRIKFKRPFPDRLWQLCTEQIKANSHLARFAPYYAASNGDALYANALNETLHLIQPHNLLDRVYSTYPFWKCHVAGSPQHCNNCTEPVTVESSTLSEHDVNFKIDLCENTIQYLLIL